MPKKKAHPKSGSVKFDQTAEKDFEALKKSHGQGSKKQQKEVEEFARVEVKDRHALGALREMNALVVSNISGCVTQNFLTPHNIWAGGDMRRADDTHFWKEPEELFNPLFRALALSCEAKWDNTLLRSGEDVYDPSSCEDWPVKGKGWDAAVLKFVEMYGPNKSDSFDSVVRSKTEVYNNVVKLNKSFFKKKEDGDPRRYYIYRRGHRKVGDGSEEKNGKAKGKGKKKKKTKAKKDAKEGESLPYEVFVLVCGKDPLGIFARCSHIRTPSGVEEVTHEWQHRVEEAVAKMEEREALILGLAECQLDTSEYPPDFSFKTDPCNFPTKDGFTFLGMISARDAPRGNAAKAFKICRNMGVQVILTSAYMGPVAMKKFCRRVGYLKTTDYMAEDLAEGEPVDEDAWKSDEVKAIHLDGYTLDTMDKGTLDQMLLKRRVIVTRCRRVDLIVDALRRQGKTIGLIGGGFDAATFPKVDVSVSGGAYSVPRSKKNADLVLKDKSFTSLVRAMTIVKPFEHKKKGLGKLFGKKKKKQRPKAENQQEESNDGDHDNEGESDTDPDDEEEEKEDHEGKHSKSKKRRKARKK